MRTEHVWGDCRRKGEVGLDYVGLVLLLEVFFVVDVDDDVDRVWRVCCWAGEGGVSVLCCAVVCDVLMLVLFGDDCLFRVCVLDVVSGVW